MQNTFTYTAASIRFAPGELALFPFYLGESPNYKTYSFLWEAEYPTGEHMARLGRASSGGMYEKARVSSNH